jgi:hypothetical protein
VVQVCRGQFDRALSVQSRSALRFAFAAA